MGAGGGCCVAGGAGGAGCGSWGAGGAGAAAGGGGGSGTGAGTTGAGGALDGSADVLCVLCGAAITVGSIGLLQPTARALSASRMRQADFMTGPFCVLVRYNGSAEKRRTGTGRERRQANVGYCGEYRRL